MTYNDFLANRVRKAFANKNAASLARLNETFGFQSGDCFTDDCAADAETAGHAHFRRKARSRREVFAANQLDKRLANAIGKRACDRQSFDFELGVGVHFGLLKKIL